MGKFRLALPINHSSMAAIALAVPLLLFLISPLLSASIVIKAYGSIFKGKLAKNNLFSPAPLVPLITLVSQLVTQSAQDKLFSFVLMLLHSSMEQPVSLVLCQVSSTSPNFCVTPVHLALILIHLLTHVDLLLPLWLLLKIVTFQSAEISLEKFRPLTLYSPHAQVTLPFGTVQHVQPAIHHLTSILTQKIVSSAKVGTNSIWPPKFVKFQTLLLSLTLRIKTFTLMEIGPTWSQEWLQSKLKTLIFKTVEEVLPFSMPRATHVYLVPEMYLFSILIKIFACLAEEVVNSMQTRTSVYQVLQEPLSNV